MTINSRSLLNHWNYTTPNTTQHHTRFTSRTKTKMPNSDPPSSFWCLRFKLNRTTVFLHVDALQTLASVRAELLNALQITNPDGIFKGTLSDGTPVEYPLPTTAEDIALAKRVDINDANAGWEAIGDDLEDGLVFDEDVSGKGKGKAASRPLAAAPKKSASAASKGANDCPQGAGLRDNGVVAFRFRLPEEKARRQRLIEGNLDVDEIARDGMGDDTAWDVIVPTYEETYEAEDATEMG